MHYYITVLTHCSLLHDDVIKWKHFPHYWGFVRGIHRSPVNSPHKGQWRGALMFSLICTWINSWVNNPEAGDLSRHRAHCDVSVMDSTDIDLCQHWLWQWLVAWGHQTITWTNADSRLLASIPVQFHRKCTSYAGKKYQLFLIFMHLPGNNALTMPSGISSHVACTESCLNRWPCSNPQYLLSIALASQRSIICGCMPYSLQSMAGLEQIPWSF